MNPEADRPTPPFDWRVGLEQFARLGEELRALGSGAFEAASERAGLVSRERFEVQAALLASALERLAALESRIDALEPHAPAQDPPPA